MNFNQAEVKDLPSEYVKHLIQQCDLKLLRMIPCSEETIYDRTTGYLLSSLSWLFIMVILIAFCKLHFLGI